MNGRMVGVGLAAGFVLALGVACGSDSTSAPKKEQFVATLSGDAERPPVASTSTGTALVTIEDANTISYKVDVANVNDITLSHFHGATPDVSGKIIFDFAPGARAGSFSGTLESGTVTRTSTFAPGFTFDSLLTRLRTGALYVNVHTNVNKGGEIRGNLVPKP
jgi:hypothetical protein